MGLFRRRKKESELTDLLQGYELPSFSTVVMDVLSLLRNKDSEFNDIAKTINYDPAMVLAVFKMVNSAAFGLSRHVDDIKQAVTLLGRARLESIVLTQAIREAQPEIDVKWFNTTNFWSTSAKRATLARHLANKLHPSTATQAFTAGMLQDMGIPVLVSVLNNKYAKVIETISQNDVPIIEVEQDLLKFDHQKVGKLMASEWNLPDQLTTSISAHHNLNDVEPAIGLVSYLKNETLEDSINRVLDKCTNNFNIKEEEVHKIIEQSFEEASTIKLS